MKVRVHLWVLGLAAVGALGASGLVSPLAAEEESVLSPGIPRSKVSARDAEDGVLEVFASIERAWSSAQAESLVTLLDPEEKVHLAFARGGPRGGYFNRDQAFFLLKDLLEYTKTDRFEFQKYWNLDSSGRSPYAVARRTYRMNDGATHSDQIYISLRKRQGAWVVGEIRSVEP